MCAHCHWFTGSRMRFDDQRFDRCQYHRLQLPIAPRNRSVRSPWRTSSDFPRRLPSHRYPLHQLVTRFSLFRFRKLILFVFKVIYYFLFHTYGTSDLIGSPGKLYDLLKEAALAVPVEGNHEGSYLTMKSNSGLLFAASTIATGFSVSLSRSLRFCRSRRFCSKSELTLHLFVSQGVFLDQGYWQRAIASRPESTTKAYFLGAISWVSSFDILYRPSSPRFKRLC